MDMYGLLWDTCIANLFTSVNVFANPCDIRTWGVLCILFCRKNHWFLRNGFMEGAKDKYMKWRNTLLTLDLSNLYHWINKIAFTVALSINLWSPLWGLPFQFAPNPFVIATLCSLAIYYVFPPYLYPGRLLLIRPFKSNGGNMFHGFQTKCQDILTYLTKKWYYFKCHVLQLFVLWYDSLGISHALAWEATYSCRGREMEWGGREWEEKEQNGKI